MIEQYKNRIAVYYPVPQENKWWIILRTGWRTADGNREILATTKEEMMRELESAVQLPIIKFKVRK